MYERVYIHVLSRRFFIVNKDDGKRKYRPNNLEYTIIRALTTSYKTISNLEILEY